MAPLILPRVYGVPLPDLHELDGEAAEVVAQCRAHPAGQFADRLYGERVSPSP